MVGITRRLKKTGKVVRERLKDREDLVGSTLKLQAEGAKKSLKKRRMFAEDILR